MYTNVSKPTGTNYTNLTHGIVIYDDSTFIYDDSATPYDGFDATVYTNLAKPTSSVYTKIAKPT